MTPALRFMLITLASVLLTATMFLATFAAAFAPRTAARDHAHGASQPASELLDV